MKPSARRLAVMAGTAATAWFTDRMIRHAVAGHERWERANFRGTTVLLSAGPAVAGAGLVGAAAVPDAAPALVVGAAAAALGLYDDLYGDSHARGLRGHLRALADRRVTTGMVKLAGLTTAAFLAAAVQRRRVAPAVVDAALVAGSANLVNLLDLRPGRALKAVTVVAALNAPRAAAAGGVASVAAAAALATLPSDLSEQVMIGDCGANTLGAMLGWSLATGAGPRGRAAALAVVVGLTLASERVSFTAVIERTPWLSAVDRWGRL